MVEEEEEGEEEEGIVVVGIIEFGENIRRWVHNTSFPLGSVPYSAAQ